MATLRQLRNQALKATERCAWRYDMCSTSDLEFESTLGWPGAVEANDLLTEEREVIMTLIREELEEYIAQVAKFEELLERWEELTVGIRQLFVGYNYEAMFEVFAEAAESGLAA